MVVQHLLCYNMWDHLMRLVMEFHPQHNIRHQILLLCVFLWDNTYLWLGLMLLALLGNKLYHFDDLLDNIGIYCNLYMSHLLDNTYHHSEFLLLMFCHSTNLYYIHWHHMHKLDFHYNIRHYHSIVL